METKEWFTEWFNTPYYHILYKDRNDADAQLFMKNITEFLALPKTTHILDLPCGKGRHSVYLNSLGYKVTGGDLAENSISIAKKFENDTLKFKVHDMRKPFNNSYDAIFNLFTSFGYFEEDKEDVLILQNIKNGLNKDGYFVFDFLNVELVKRNLVAKETKVVEDITFYITREIKDGFIIKNINFFADNENRSYTERVKYIDERKLKSYFEKVGFSIENIFGDYHLNSFNSKISNRLIVVAK
ncbi:class I SAM-dependent DNA methyltransferase [Polaribacter dokdonensis]|uniref:Methyltransferase domain-containing protein n=1 Tax=Polaribacter dokdonensis DSW-5 TaxID=1300348 RepID=A0A0M9CHM1_9FLAO|nr:class I SAM-dependent methyltransferase [Polaribacter dokdonensis]KOY52712.1 Methyltransferase family protein [Polaribacter dokdonensis DSW-5]SEE50913.1 Methyltransferase domain-containing protein [Polaribacter dokdonensis DSW-5]